MAMTTPTRITHPVAGSHATGHQALCKGLDVRQEIRSRNVPPGACGVQPREECGVAGLGCLPKHKIGDVGFRWDNNQGRNTEFAHYSSFDIHRPAQGMPKDKYAL